MAAPMPMAREAWAAMPEPARRVRLSSVHTRRDSTSKGGDTATSKITLTQPHPGPLTLRTRVTSPSFGGWGDEARPGVVFF